MAKKEKKNDSLCSTLNKGSEMVYDFYCDLCDKDHKHLEAVGFCSDCSDYLCQECYNTHLRPKPLRHHVLLDKHRMPKVTSQRLGKDVCIEPCAKHKNKTLEYYCAEHDTFGCVACITMNHCTCKGMDYIPDIAGDVLKSKEYKVMNLKLKELINTAKQVTSTTQRNTRTTSVQHSHASEFCKQLKKDFNSAVDELEALMQKKAGKIKVENQKTINSVEDRCKQLNVDIVALDSKFTSLENNGQLCQIFFFMKKSQDEIVALETSLQQLQDQSNIIEYVIKMSENLQNMIQQPETMASLEVIKNQQAPKQEHRTATAVHVADIRVKMENNTEEPIITGSVVLPGDKLVTADYDNKAVKLIDLQSNKVVSHLGNYRGVWTIAAVTNTQVAVTCPYDETILFINVTNKLTVDHKVKVNGGCHGIACMNDKLVITYCSPAKVEIISKSGKLLQTVVTEDRGNQLFFNPWYMAISPDQQTIYISDSRSHTVTSLDLRGQVKATYKDEELNEPCGLAVDRAGMLYVSGRGSTNIHQLTPDLHKIQILLQESDGIRSPYSVSYNEEQNQLYIGIVKSDIVKVYQLH